MNVHPLPDAGPEDEKAVAVLDQYVDALRAGHAPGKAAILAQHPELAAALDCLEELDRLARAAATADQRHPSRESGGDAPTLLPVAGTKGQVEPPEMPEPQSQFGKYELLGTLGRGGMGVVYMARQKDLNRIVALKMILASQFASGEQVRRFHAEAVAAAGLHHPYVLPVHEVGQVLGQHYFTMQYVKGPSLAQRLRQGPFSVEEAARCLVAVAGAVAYLHERGIIHRDLKPSNILLDEEGTPYVTDFGLVKMLEAGGDLTGTGMIVGTPSYMAPEQAAGRNAEVGPLSDVYSLGVILYEMLTGRPPFHEPTPFDTLVQVLEGEPALPRALNPRVPRELELICLKAMAKTPAQRYESAAALADDLERFLRGEIVQARSHSLFQRLVRWTRQEPGLVSRLATLAACAAIAEIYYHLAHPVTLLFHTAIQAILVVWAMVSIACQSLIRRDRSPDRVRLAWLAADAVLLTAVLLLDQAFNSPLVIAYGAFVVASGLWFRERLVWFTTAMALAGYATLVLVGISRGVIGESPQHCLIAMVSMGVLGAMVAAQVRRVRALSRYYEHRPMP